MLVPCALLSLVATLRGQLDLHVHGKSFIIRNGSHISRVPIAEISTTHPDRAVYRKDANFVVWDSRGLTIRKGRKVNTTRLPEISLTPKLFSADEIATTKKLLKKKSRSKGADALSGSRKIGDNVYCLLRWDQRDGSPWLEALISVDLASKDLHAKLLGRFEGLSAAKGKAGDALFGDEGSLRTLTRKPDRTWGVASYDIDSKEFSFKAGGQNLLRLWRLGPRAVLVEEHSHFNSKTLARVDTETGARRVTYEFQGSAEPLSLKGPLLMRFSTPDGDLLRNLDSGAELKVSQNDLARASSDGVIVWSKDDPTTAVLYSAERWNRLATADES